MMTQEEIIETFRAYPTALKSSLLRKLMRDFESDLVDQSIDEADKAKRELTVEERLAIVESLSGSLKMENPPMTKEEEREYIYQAKAEKHK